MNCLVKTWICAGVPVYLVPPQYLVPGDKIPGTLYPGVECPTLTYLVLVTPVKNSCY